MSNTEIINALSQTRFDNPNKFYDVATSIARETAKTRDEVIEIYNDSLDEEEA